MELKKYGSVITEKEIADAVYNDINKKLAQHNQITIDCNGVMTMATFCAKQIFGQLYIELTAKQFNEKIKLINVSEDLELAIRWGVLHAIEEQEKDSQVKA